jgi:hypothetical protein
VNFGRDRQRAVERLFRPPQVEGVFFFLMRRLLDPFDRRMLAVRHLDPVGRAAGAVGAIPSGPNLQQPLPNFFQLLLCFVRLVQHSGTLQNNCAFDGSRGAAVDTEDSKQRGQMNFDCSLAEP